MAAVLDGCRYSADDLLKTAEAAGFKRSYGWLRSLVGAGLLDQPDKHGIQGQRGGRAEGTWPQNQYKLFQTLLVQMKKGKTRPQTLCNVPVGLWLYFGSSYAPVRQVRRALDTFSTQWHRGTQRQARRNAREMAELFADGPDMSSRDRNHFIDTVLAADRAKHFDRKPLLAAAQKLFDPDKSGRALVGPEGAQISPEVWIQVIEARLTGIHGLGTFDDQAFEDARQAHLRHLGEYLQKQPDFASDPKIGRIFEDTSLQQLLSRACMDTLTILGFLQRANSQ